MRFRILIAPQAMVDLRRLGARDRATILDAIEMHLAFQPERTSRSRIKRLRGLSRPQFRLRVADEFRVLYDVTETTVEVLGIVGKSEVGDWLQRHGESDEESGSIGTEG